MSEPAKSIYQFFEEHGKFMYENGLITADKYMYYIRYKVYLDFIAQGNPHDKAIVKTADRNNCGTLSIRRSIKFMTDPSWRREHSFVNYRKDENGIRNHSFPNHETAQG